MNSGERAGTIRALWRYPVKSMLGEQLDAGGIQRQSGSVSRFHQNATSARRIATFGSWRAVSVPGLRLGEDRLGVAQQPDQDQRPVLVARRDERRSGWLLS
jgi:aminoglycoside phosphotransferase family enzyme